jgi:hypothetical protein
MEGFVSNECGRFLFFDDVMAAAAAIPTTPAFTSCAVTSFSIASVSKLHSPSPSGLLGRLSKSDDVSLIPPSSTISIVSVVIVFMMMMMCVYECVRLADIFQYDFLSSFVV